MHLYKQKKKIPHLGLILTLVIFAAIGGYFIYGFSDVSDSVARQQKDTLERALDKAVVSCYAIEGSYPASVSYLEEHYGVVIDHERFLVDYQTIGSNVKPGVQVVVIGGEKE